MFLGWFATVLDNKSRHRTYMYPLIVLPSFCFNVTAFPDFAFVPCTDASECIPLVIHSGFGLWGFSGLLTVNWSRHGREANHSIWVT